MSFNFDDWFEEWIKGPQEDEMARSPGAADTHDALTDDPDRQIEAKTSSSQRRKSDATALVSAAGTDAKTAQTQSGFGAQRNLWCTSATALSDIQHQYGKYIFLRPCLFLNEATGTYKIERVICAHNASTHELTNEPTIKGIFDKYTTQEIARVASRDRETEVQLQDGTIIVSGPRSAITDILKKSSAQLARDVVDRFTDYACVTVQSPMFGRQGFQPAGHSDRWKRL